MCQDLQACNNTNLFYQPLTLKSQTNPNLPLSLQQLYLSKPHGNVHWNVLKIQTKDNRLRSKTCFRAQSCIKACFFFCSVVIFDNNCYPNVLTSSCIKSQDEQGFTTMQMSLGSSHNKMHNWQKNEGVTTIKTAHQATADLTHHRQGRHSLNCIFPGLFKWLIDMGQGQTEENRRLMNWTDN